MVFALRSLLFASILIAGCSESAGIEPANMSGTECTFQFGTEAVCSYKTGKHAVKASLVTKKLADDEIALIQANVVFDGKQHTLSISPDVSMIARDIGIISFADINFDNIPDIAVSTSFGVANQYFDYWVYDPKNGNYKKNGNYNSIGNYPKLSASPTDKTLTANIKLDAATYQPQKYFWEGGKLIRKR